MFISKDICKGEGDGDYADPDNPSGYITCSGGIASKRPCPGNELVWNAEKKICDWPYNVKGYKPQDTKGSEAQKGTSIEVLRWASLGVNQRTHK